MDLKSMIGSPEVKSVPRTLLGPEAARSLIFVLLLQIYLCAQYFCISQNADRGRNGTPQAGQVSAEALTISSKHHLSFPRKVTCNCPGKRATCHHAHRTRRNLTRNMQSSSNTPSLLSHTRRVFRHMRRTSDSARGYIGYQQSTTRRRQRRPSTRECQAC